MAEQPLAFVQKRVVIDASRPGYLSATLRMTPKFRPAADQCAPSVTPKDIEFAQAPVALVRRYLSELGPGRLSVRDWIDRERSKRVGKRGAGFNELTADLMGVPLTSELKQTKGFHSYVRSLQRSASQTKEGRKFEHGAVGVTRADIRKDIKRLKGGELGNPFAPATVVLWARVKSGQFRLFIQGDFVYPRTFCKRYWAPDEMIPAEQKPRGHEASIYDVLKDGGASFYDFVLDDYQIMLEGVIEDAKSRGKEVKNEDVTVTLERAQQIGLTSYFPDERGKRL